MNTPDNFDELSRRKLAEREFPFDETHWLDVQRSLSAERKRKVTWLPWAAGAVLLLGIGAWWAASGTTVDDVQSQVVQAARNEIPARGQTTSETTEARSVNTAAAGEQGATNGIPDLKAAPLATAEADRTENGNSEHKRLAKPLRTSPATNVPTSTSVADASDVSSNASNVPELVMDVVPSGSGGETVGTVQPVQEGTTGSAAESTTDHGDHAGAEVAIQADVTVPVQTDAPPAAEGSGPSVTTEKTAEAPTEVALAPTGDTSLASTAPIELPRADPTGRWEISAMAGVLSTGSTYAGGNSVQWTNALTNSRTATFGVELMRMGKNTGIGTGIHYSQYAEHFSEADRFRTDIDFRNYYFLQTFDTTVTIVVGIDTVGGDTAYITQQVNTPISTLGVGVDTVATTTLESEARTHVNVVSYLEIPLLFDAHLVQGRWSLGLRGGPFLGVLSGRRGALPNNAWDGYTDLADQPFRSLVFGYTARAYVRYRFNAAWSVGLEPCIRGQLINAYSGGDVTRRSTGIGALLSLSYSLR
ncbi:MAG: hypothetical protein WAU70_13505 [Flavobacteriales bacterium]